MTCKDVPEASGIESFGVLWEGTLEAVLPDSQGKAVEGSGRLAAEEGDLSPVLLGDQFCCMRLLCLGQE